MRTVKATDIYSNFVYRNSTLHETDSAGRQLLMYASNRRFATTTS